ACYPENPCLNNGKCTFKEIIQNFVCDCEYPYTGDTCEIKDEFSTDMTDITSTSPVPITKSPSSTPDI
ncbi:hypothetical protein NPIL_54291, partial [Nephila pilipes]